MMKGKVDSKDVEIKKGDWVDIKAYGVTRGGQVMSVSYYPQILDEEDYGWQIEFMGDTGYGHWKEWEDGGGILKINGIEV